MHSILRCPLFLFLGVLGLNLAAADPTLTVTPEKSSALYQLGEKIVWDVKVSGDPDGTLKTASYVLKKGGGTVIGQGDLTFQPGGATAGDGGTAKIETSLAEPGTILAEVTTPAGAGKKGLRVLGGAAVAYDRIPRSAPCPADFDAFWKSKLAELAAVPAHPVLEKGDSGRPGVDYWKITLDNVNGTHVQGQLARPSGDKKAPAMLIVQWAGVYPLQKKWAVDRAAEGWLVLNIMAHDLPIDQPADFYLKQSQNELKGYRSVGDTDRDKSYFLRMFLGDVQSAEYLAGRPDWDGKTLVVTGTSQGGLQSFATAALDPKVTAMLVLVPAGCDDSAALVGRKPGFPFYLTDVTSPGNKQILQTSAYFDAVNFAARVKCPALVALGLLDETAPPSGVFAAFNQLQGPKEACVLPNSDHQGYANSQAPYGVRSAAWRKALLAGNPPPIPAKP
jgi:cephalosporin-C deacetylase